MNPYQSITKNLDLDKAFKVYLTLKVDPKVKEMSRKCEATETVDRGLKRVTESENENKPQ